MCNGWLTCKASAATGACLHNDKQHAQPVLHAAHGVSTSEPHRYVRACPPVIHSPSCTSSCALSAITAMPVRSATYPAASAAAIHLTRGYLLVRAHVSSVRLIAPSELSGVCCCCAYGISCHKSAAEALHPSTSTLHS